MFKMLSEKLNKFNITVFSFKLFDLISLAARVGLGIVFILAAISKIPDIAQFQNNVYNYHMLPQTILPIFSFMLPWIELIVGIYLVIGLFPKATATVSFVLLAMFMVAIAYALLTNQPVTGCGCFSQAPTERIGWIDEVRDTFFVILAVITYITSNHLLSINNFIFNKKRSLNEEPQGSSTI